MLYIRQQRAGTKTPASGCKQPRPGRLGTKGVLLRLQAYQAERYTESEPWCCDNVSISPLRAKSWGLGEWGTPLNLITLAPLSGPMKPEEYGHFLKRGGNERGKRPTPYQFRGIHSLTGPCNTEDVLSLLADYAPRSLITLRLGSIILGSLVSSSLVGTIPLHHFFSLRPPSDCFQFP